MGREHASSESSPIPGVLTAENSTTAAALPLVNKLFLQLMKHYVYIVTRKTTVAIAMKPRIDI
jgi:hypothetical protein